MVAQGELTREVAGLPTIAADADLNAKEFDVLILNLQLGVLRVQARFDELKENVIALAGAMEEKQAIPMVRDQLLLIQEVQTTQFWQGVTVSELESVRLRLRALVKFIDKKRREPVYTTLKTSCAGWNPFRCRSFPPGSTQTGSARRRSPFCATTWSIRHCTRCDGTSR